MPIVDCKIAIPDDKELLEPSPHHPAPTGDSQNGEIHDVRSKTTGNRVTGS